MLYKKIWIPSQQKFWSIKELSVIEYKDLYKCIDDNTDFVEYLNSYIVDNNKYGQDISDLTIIDRFVIFLYLKVYSCGPTISYTKDCPKCGTKINTTYDLNALLDKLAPVIDKKFEHIFGFDNYSLVCDIPTIKDSDMTENIEKTEDDYLYSYLYSHIKRILINKDYINLYGLSRRQKTDLYNSINYKDILKIKEDFIDPTYKQFTNLELMSMRCSNNKCNHEIFKMNFNTGNMTDIIRMLFMDDSLEHILSVIAATSSHTHLDFRTYENISPMELDIIFSTIPKNSDSSDPAPDSQETTDLFEQYRMDTKGMVESASEFQ